MFLGDTLASHAVGGFKVGVGFALRKCRNCMATGDEIQHLVSIVLCFLYVKLTAVLFTNCSTMRSISSFVILQPMIGSVICWWAHCRTTIV